MEDNLYIYVVYDHPKDFPDGFVIREWDGVIPKKIVFTSNDIDVIRGFLKMRGLVNIGRLNQDDPKILEVWM